MVTLVFSTLSSYDRYGFSHAHAASDTAYFSDPLTVKARKLDQRAHRAFDVSGVRVWGMGSALSVGVRVWGVGSALSVNVLVCSALSVGVRVHVCVCVCCACIGINACITST